jgi:Glycosyl transferase family 2
MIISDSRSSLPEQSLAGTFRVVIAMMERDEEARLEAWILYHARLFGFESLYIYDNGSTSKLVRQILTKYAARGVHVDYSYTGSKNFSSKGDIFTEKFIELEQDSRNLFFIPLDCDEFLTLRGPDGLLTGDRSTIHAYLDTLVHDQHILVARDAYANVLGYPGHFFPAYAHHKVFFAEGCCTWMDEGFHCARSRKIEEERVTDFVYLHFHYRPFEDMVQQSTRKLAHLVDITDADKLREYKGSGFHVVQYLSVTETDYINGFQPGQGIYLPWLVSFFKKLGVDADFFRSI